MAEPHGSTALSPGAGAGSPPGGALLEVQGLSSAYGPVRALDEVTLSAEAGRITAVLGANGAGKTTLLRTISGLVRSTAGRVLLGGEDITRAPVEAMVGKGMAHVPEGRGVIAELTVDENLRVGSLFRGKVAKEEFDRIYDLFPRIAERRDNPAHTLSGGERQMLVIGRALLAKPRILLLDEPSLGLAPRIVAQIFGLLRQLVDAEGLSVLLVEQNARSALSVADVGVVLNLGRVVVTDDARTLMADEGLRHAYLGF
jgi:branched-chain amino acid transport system ATP-binding protein